MKSKKKGTQRNQKPRWHLQVHNFNINELAHSSPSEESVVPVHFTYFSSWNVFRHSMCTSLPFNVYLWLNFQKVVSHVLAEIVDTFGWSSVLLVYFNDGVTRLYLITSHSTHLPLSLISTSLCCFPPSLLIIG